MRVLIFTFLLISIVLVPFLVFAQSGLVPCGNPGQPACTTCDFMVLANKIIKFLFQMIILPLAALGVLASGIVLLTAGGSESRIAMGKTMLWNILIGFFIAISAWAIINTVLGNIIKTGGEDKFYNPLTEKFPGC